MFREMRRSRQQLPEDEARAILERGSHGILAVLGDEGYPYAVPISYTFADGKIYMHCAKTGHKIDAIRACDKASFCVVDADDVVPEEFTTHYRSAIAFGRVREITSDAEKRNAVTKLCAKYCSELPNSEWENAIEREWTPLNVLEFTIEHLTAKEARELVMLRDGN